MTSSKNLLQTAQGEKKELQRKLRAVEDVIAAYSQPKRQPQSDPFGILENVKREMEFAKAAGEHGPFRTSRILQSLTDRGIHIAGKKPGNILSAKLSRSPDFQSHGKDGWTLIDEGGK